MTRKHRRNFLKALGAVGLGVVGAELYERVTPYGLQDKLKAPSPETTSLQMQIDNLNEELRKKTVFHDEFGATEFLVAVGYMAFWDILKDAAVSKWKQLVLHHPILGEYKSSDELTITYHLNWMLRSGIKCLMFEFGWIRPNSAFDEVARNNVLKHNLVRYMKFFMQEGGVLQRIPEKTVLDDYRFMAANYLNHPSYLTLDGRHVVMQNTVPFYWRDLGIDGTNKLFNEVKRVVRTEFGYDLLLIADVWPVFNESVLDNPDMPFDAIMNYGNLFSSVGPSPATYEQYATKYSEYWRRWSTIAKKRGLQFIPQIWPGFDNTPLVNAGGAGNPDYHKTPWIMTRNSDKFVELLQFAKEVTTAPLNLILIESWNDFHEGHSIEPTKEYGFTYLDAVRRAFVKEYVIEGK